MACDIREDIVLHFRSFHSIQVLVPPSFTVTVVFDWVIVRYKGAYVNQMETATWLAIVLILMASIVLFFRYVTTPIRWVQRRFGWLPPEERRRANTQSAASSMEELSGVIIVLTKKEVYVEGKINKLTAEARDMMSQGRKDQAMICLRRKKAMQASLTKSTNLKFHLQTVQDNIGDVTLTHDIFRALEQNNQVMQELNKTMNLDSADKIMDELREASQDVGDVMKVLGGGDDSGFGIANVDPDEEAAIEDELNQMIMEDMPGVSSGLPSSSGGNTGGGLVPIDALDNSPAPVREKFGARLNRRLGRPAPIPYSVIEEEDRAGHELREMMNE